MDTESGQQEWVEGLSPAAEWDARVRSSDFVRHGHHI